MLIDRDDLYGPCLPTVSPWQDECIIQVEVHLLMACAMNTFASQENDSQVFRPALSKF
jgi:hypothetical protein